MVAGPLRIVFFGTPEFAVPALDGLLGSRHSVVGVVTQPDRPRGRGRKTTAAPVKARALAAGLPVFQPDRLRDSTFMAALAALDADLGVVAAYGRILTDEILATPRLGLINVHASLLPTYRGAAPVHRAVIAGESETGVTIMRLVKALDAGPMLAYSRRRIESVETSEQVERDLARIGAGLLVSTVDEIAAGRATQTPQDEARVTYAHRLTKEDGSVDWRWSAERIHNLIRGLHPWPHAFTFLDGKRFVLLRSRVVSGPSAGGTPGAILTAAGDTLRVATGSGVIQVEEIQAEGRRSMHARDFLAGHALSSGTHFGPAA